MDIPVYHNIVESLHLLFTTFMEFKDNPHFMQLGSGAAAPAVGLPPEAEPRVRPDPAAYK